MDFSNIIYDGDEVRTVVAAAGAVSSQQSQGQGGQDHDDNGGSGSGSLAISSPNQSVYSTDSLESFTSLSLFDDMSSSSNSNSPRTGPLSGDEDSGAGSSGSGSGRNTSFDSGLRSSSSCSNENEVEKNQVAGDGNGGSSSYSGAEGGSTDADTGNEDNYHYNNNMGIGYSEYAYDYDFQQQQQQQQMQTHVILFMPQDQGGASSTSNEFSPSINEPMVSRFVIPNGQDNGLFPLPPGPPPALPLFPNQVLHNATLVSTNDHNAYGGGYSSTYFQNFTFNGDATATSCFSGAAEAGNGYFDNTGTFIGTPEQLYQFCDPNNISISTPAGMFNGVYPCLVNEDLNIMGEEFSPGTYVSSVFDPSCLNMNGIKYNQCNYQYFVPPMVEDGDYFGGQQPIWQNRITQSFEKFSPDVWIMKGVEEIKNLYRTYWHVFTITAKLRFCCRSCKRPWTSMRGRIIFCFNLDQINHRGYVFMKIFGQKCVQLTCNDTEEFQVPACYPEEIHRVMWKVSEYIGYIFYNIPLTAQFFLEPDKAYRGGNPSTPHRKSVCQACSSGFCSAAKAKNFLTMQS